jgi:hypothetical protein
MLSTKMAAAAGFPGAVPKCNHCRRVPAAVSMSGYSENGFDLCVDCSLQLVRKITEDLCELITKGGRHE